MTSKSQSAAEDIAALLRARNPLIWIVTREEARAEQYVVEAAAAANYVPRMWDVDQGATRIDGKKESVGGSDPSDMLAAIRERAGSPANAERGLWVMRDLPVWLEGPSGASVLRKLPDLHRLAIIRK